MKNLASKLPDFFSARISSGTYNTSDYRSKSYSTKAGLLKGLKAHGFFKAHKAISEESAIDQISFPWNSGSVQYRVTLDFDE